MRQIRASNSNTTTTKQQKQNNKVIASAVATKIAVELLQAPVLTEGEIDELEIKKEANMPLTSSEMNSLEKMHLAGYYHVCAPNLTLEQLERLPKLKSQFK